MRTGMRATLLLAAFGVASAVTPIEKVVTLLKDLQAKIEKQGTLEATQYDKYACFCTNQAKFKAAAIAKSKEAIEVADADLKDLTAQITAADAESKKQGDIVKDMAGDSAGADSDAKDGKIQVETDKRAKAHALYLGKAKDLNNAIAACQEALENLKASKTSMTDAKLNLAQLKAAASSYKLSQTPVAMSAALALVKTASAIAQSGDAKVSGGPAKFEFQGNAIIAMIEKLSDDFKENKKTLDEDEMTARSISESDVLKNTNKRNFAQKEKDEQDNLSQAKSAEKGDTQTARDKEDEDMKSDEAFVKQLEGDCAQKAKDWDQRSKSRGDEMSALAEATATLEKGALSQYGANKKLSFLQRRSVGGKTMGAAVTRVLAKLDASSKSLKSPGLSALALKVALTKDHFTNVRALIKDLMAKLKSDAKAEQTTKNFCDKNMKDAIDNRDQAASDTEKQEGIIASKSALAAQKAEAIQKFAVEIAELNKGLLEAEELRASEKSANEQSVQEATAGGKAVASALSVLEGFYKQKFLQVDYKPPSSGRDGLTVADMAPEAFSGETKGSQESAKGILGILEVIKADFARTVTTVEKEEKEAVTEYEAFKKKSDADIVKKAANKKTAGTDKSDAEGAVLSAQDDKDDAQNLRESALEALEKLSPMCVEGEETYAERVQKRKDEIAALKEAVKILDDWQN